MCDCARGEYGGTCICTVYCPHPLCTTQAGHVCGDSMDIVNGRPTGSVRISFGYTSTKGDAERFIQFIKECFMVVAPQPSNNLTPHSMETTDGKGTAPAAGEQRLWARVSTLSSLEIDAINERQTCVHFLHPTAMCKVIRACECNGDSYTVYKLKLQSSFLYDNTHLLLCVVPCQVTLSCVQCVLL